MAPDRPSDRSEGGRERERETGSMESISGRTGCVSTLKEEFSGWFIEA